MPYALIMIGAVIFLSAIRGDLGTLGSLLKRDLLGGGNFVYWIVAIFILGALGYIKSVKPFSDAFLVLVIIVFVVANKGFFASFQSALAQIKAGNCPQSGAGASNSGIGLGGASASGLTSWDGLTNSAGIAGTPQGTATNAAPAGMLSITVTPSGAY